MRIGRSIPPAAAPLSIVDIVNGFFGLLNPRSALQRFQKSICEMYSVKHCFLVSSGKAALSLTFQTLSKRYPERNQVVIPAYNCYSVPSAIVNAGLTPVSCEVDAATLRFKRESLSSLLKNSDRILAVCPTHLFGLPEDVSEIKSLIQDKNITVIEDSAQAMGGTYNGNFLGTQGDVGIFSLARGKALSAGEGGIIITDNDLIADGIATLMVDISRYTTTQLIKLILQSIALTALIHPCLFWIPKMMPFLRLGETIYDPDFQVLKLSGFQAGLAKNWVSKIDWLRKERSARIQLYLEKLKGLDGITLIAEQYKEEQLSCIRFPVKLYSKEVAERIILESDRRGFGISMTYPDAIDTIPQISGKKKSDFTIAQECTQTLITLPCHPLVGRTDLENIVSLIRSIAI